MLASFFPKDDLSEFKDMKNACVLAAALQGSTTPGDCNLHMYVDGSLILGCLN